MKKSLVFIVILALIAGLTAFFYTRSGGQPQTNLSTTPTPYNLSTLNMWNGISPGKSSTQDLVTNLKEASPGAQNGNVTTYSYPSTNQYWKNEVDVENDTVVFIRERIFPPTETSFKILTAKIAEKPTPLYGPDHQSGTLLYLYPANGVAYMANSIQDTVYQIWRFPSTTTQGFLSMPQSSGYGLAPTGQPEGI